MDHTNDPIQKRIGEFVEAEIPKCSFVGISSDKEVFLSFKEVTPEEESAARKTLKEKFGDEIKTLATVVSVSIDEVSQLVDGLNQALKEDVPKEKPQLLDIGSF